MASHGYTYVPSKDLSPNVRIRDEQIRAKDFDELKAYMRAMHEEMNATAAKFQRLCTYNEMIQSGLYWKDFAKHKGMQAATIGKISNVNLGRCAREVECISPKFLPLIEKLEKFDWVLKHNTKPDHIETILKDRTILSLTEIHRRGLGGKLKGGTEHEGRDHIYIHNEDFVFFRLAFGNQPAHSRFGSECLVFKADQLFRTGWITLYDMLKPDSTDRIARLDSLNFEKDKMLPQKKNPFGQPLRSISSDPVGITMRYQKSADKGEPKELPAKASPSSSSLQKLPASKMPLSSGCLPTMGRGMSPMLPMSSGMPRSVGAMGSMGGMTQMETRTLHRAEIVFYGRDIRRGIAFSMVSELNLMGGASLLERVMAAEDAVLAQIVANLFWFEAKMPRVFQFSGSELLAHHSSVPYTKSTFE
jgi:hypothetical protein